MKIGVPKEIKDQEFRVALTPAGAAQLCNRGHRVYIERGAGNGAGFSDADYQAAGAQLAEAAQCWDSDLVVKVKEPLPSEYAYLRGQMLFTYLHLAGVATELTAALLSSHTSALAYETLEDAHGRLPLLAPMSAIAGDMAALMGAYYLAKFNGGKGQLLGQVLRRRHGKVLVIGDGIVGQHAARTALALGAQVVMLGRRAERLAQLRADCGVDLQWLPSTDESLWHELPDTDVLIGAVLQVGAKAPHVVSAAMIETLQPGSVVVDVSIDQGGCIATSRPTRHSDPVYSLHGVLHYCVTNMPGAYPRTATLALTDATLPYVQRLADHGLAALNEDAGFAQALNTHQGYITYRPVAEALQQLDRYVAFAL